ncbi:hypothetical protein O7635_15630 [Asanoa sp. WMMD1127]|uniref:hypothetical protein n=1 Tax=Asanoa sp. WMMD1127 TaxID=3016107 RepID=UPI002415FB14|nr:hypothetical protein [Asanoa sp. WMMD1127]MDG4823286.1 hypothetical protein [Asanoa sp. WMMD1127]
MTAYILPDGNVLRVTKGKTVHRVVRGRPIIEHVAIEVGTTALNLVALSFMARILKF